MKRYLPQKFHILGASGIFLAILILIYLIVSRHNQRLDLTQEKLHSLASETLEVLDRMKQGEIQIVAFFAEEDPGKKELGVLLKEMATHHPRFRQTIYDPDHSPSMAQKYRVDQYRTVLIHYEGRQERMNEFSEEAITNALVRLAHPKAQNLCFTTGHGEISLSDTSRTGFSEWRKTLEDYQYQLKEVQLTGPGIPEECSVLVMAGPHYELESKEIKILQNYPQRGKGFLLLIDPMDRGEGATYSLLGESFGFELGNNVVVDKMSQMVGGDYLVPLMNQYAPNHPITAKFQAATFFPIARTIRRSEKVPAEMSVLELGITSPGSWAETNLKKLESGEAEFNPKEDVQGPLSLAAVAEIREGRKRGRVTVVGDSDFLINAHLKLSGNRDFALNILQWLARDDRWVAVRAREPRFEPLFLKVDQSVGISAFVIGVLPAGALVIGSVGIWFRRRQSA